MDYGSKKGDIPCGGGSHMFAVKRAERVVRYVFENDRENESL